MKVLILHASLGSGHISAAAAVRRAIEARGAEVRTEDALEYTNAVLRNLVKTLITKFSQESPALYRALYEGTDATDPEASMRSNELYGQLQAPMYQRLADLIEDYGPDRIICAQQLPALVVRALAAQGKVDVPWYVVITDYMAHSSWILSGVTGYFVPWYGVADILESWGIPAETLHVTGIPVQPELAEPKDPIVTREKHGLADGPLVLAIASGVDSERFVAAVDSLAASLDHGTVLTVAGRNEEVMEMLTDMEQRPRVTIDIRGFVDYLDDLIAAADVVVTKTGGLITTEVLTRQTPLVALDPFPGQEEWNADFVSGSGSGIQIRVPDMVGPAVRELLADPERRESMSEKAGAVAKPRAAEMVADIVLAD